MAVVQPNPLNNMGLHALGSANLILKRKFRWTFEVQDICRGEVPDIPPEFVKSANRPQLDIEEQELNFLHSKTWIPGKAAWQQLTIMYYDAATVDLQPLWSWLVSVYGFMPSIQSPNAPNYFMGSKQSDYTANAYLTEWDGCGQPISGWWLKYVWPQSINFGDLDYSSSEECTVELTLRYSDAEYESWCPPMKVHQCCSPCGDTTIESDRRMNLGHRTS